MEIEEGEIIKEQRAGEVLKIYFNSKDAMVLHDREIEPVPHADEMSTTAASTTAASTSSEDGDNGLPAKWVAPKTHLKIQAAIGAPPSATCRLCKYECTSRKRLILHARIHYVHCLCICGYASRWRESVRKHRIDGHNDCNPTGPIYEVDRDSFPRWRRGLEVKLATYPGDDAEEAPVDSPPTGQTSFSP